MKYTTLPNTKIKISKICLGTMTFGKQNTEKEGHNQMDLAVDNGVNFFDTAELYPVPAEGETYSRTEEIIGTWFKKNSNRENIILASKIAGPGDYTKHIRSTGFQKQAINEALDNSLKRLQTDYIDLYQLHWPERYTNTFGIRGFNPKTSNKWADNFHEVLESLNELIKIGKIRQIGLSNENPWAIMRYNDLSKKGFPMMITVQNSYSLLNRTYEIGNAEISIQEDIGLLAYSPLACGELTAKYIMGLDNKKSRLNLFKKFIRYSNENCKIATTKYNDLATKHNLSLTQMALAFVNSRPFVTSNIIGATDLNQLKENIDSIEVELSQEVLNGIQKIHMQIPDPAC